MPEGNLVTIPAATYPPPSLQLSGQHGIKLVPLTESHVPSLYLNLGSSDHSHLYRYIPFGPFSDLAAFTDMITAFITSPAVCAFASSLLHPRTFRTNLPLGRRQQSASSHISTAWYSCIDDDWNGGVKAAIEAWLDPRNFVDGKQVKKLEDFRKAAAA
ncbi:hypothetical protein EG328_007913 [Venturia inaequalis]|uniref:Uncharacterized protein n=1 Tax=Venturia inaequalis TaxID=5025 RepID=A0A8H3UFT7_VENIN|nr:hypothetical protein EG328_007913 [Venturia inaequalis]RDI83599.1 hypothetical protein Vi05172_g6355 [Venturia inaequalis]